MTAISVSRCAVARLCSVRLLLQTSWVGIVAASLIACSTGREVSSEYNQFPTTLNGRDVVVAHFKGVRRVYQAAPDVCWAAAMEQALAHQGVELDQRRLVEMAEEEFGAKGDRRLNLFWWQFAFRIFQAPLSGGSEVWVRTDADGWEIGAPILSVRTFQRKIGRELAANRIALVGISTGDGGGHVVTVFGAAFPIDDRKLTIGNTVGYLVYDPLTAKVQLISLRDLFSQFAGMVYITTHDSGIGAATAITTTTVW